MFCSAFVQIEGGNARLQDLVGFLSLRDKHILGFWLLVLKRAGDTLSSLVAAAAFMAQ